GSKKAALSAAGNPVRKDGVAIILRCRCIIQPSGQLDDRSVIWRAPYCEYLDTVLLQSGHTMFQGVSHEPAAHVGFAQPAAEHDGGRIGVNGLCSEDTH